MKKEKNGLLLLLSTVWARKLITKNLYIIGAGKTTSLCSHPQSQMAQLEICYIYIPGNTLRSHSNSTLWLISVQ